MQSLYSVLRVAPKAGNAEIKSAFRALAKTFHPDLKPDDKQAEHRFNELNHAYSILSDPEARNVYDTYLAEKRASARQRFRRTAKDARRPLPVGADLRRLQLPRGPFQEDHGD